MRFAVSPAVTAFCFTLLAFPVAARAQTPTLSATVGSGTSLAYFVLDFRDGTATPSYAFAYRWNPASLTPTEDNLLDALQAGAPTFSETFQTFNFGGGPTRFYTAFGYAGKTRTNDFPNNSWSFFTSIDGKNGDWTYSNVGASSYNLVNGQYTGFAYGSSTTPPTTPGLSAAGTTSPEPEALALFLFGGIGFVAARRRRQK